MATAGDELSLLLVKGELDIALLPANMAAILYQKTEGQITVLNLNTLGVLYGVSGDAEITSLEDLKGRTVYLTGKGATPEASLRYLLSEAGLTEQEHSGISVGGIGGSGSACGASGSSGRIAPALCDGSPDAE